MTATQPGALPLQGIRVLDFGMFWAGPFAGKWLADAGAEVIKIESPSHPDNLRILARDVYPDGDPGVRSWNRSGMINERNRNKLGIALEMGTPEGREIFRRLVAISDVVLHNFSTRVLANWDLEYEALRTINNQIVLASIYSQGAHGPESEFVSFGGTLEQLGGLTALNGYPGEMSGVLTLQLPDPFGGAMAAALILAALRKRHLTGEGSHIDLSQRENVTAFLGPLLLDYQMNARIPAPQGNRDQHMAPHGVYRCAGDDAWVTLAVRHEIDWANLCQALGSPELVEDPRFLGMDARQAHVVELDAIISEWAASMDKREAMGVLRRWDIPSGAVTDAQDLYADPHLEARGFWETIEDPDAGVHRYPGRPFKLSRTPLSTRRPTPTLGQHNEYVLRDLLGMSEEEVRQLAADGTIGVEPTEAARRGQL